MAERCGRCHGRRTIKDLHGLGVQPCPACRGTGEKKPKASLGRSQRQRYTRTDDPYDVSKYSLDKCGICGNPALEWHHVIAVQRILRLLPEGLLQVQAIRDIRNLIAVCRPCHERIETAALNVSADEMHAEFAQYVEDYDLVAGLPRHMTDHAQEVAP